MLSNNFPMLVILSILISTGVLVIGLIYKNFRSIFDVDGWGIFSAFKKFTLIKALFR